MPLETQQTPNALKKLLEDLGDDSPLPAPPQFGRYDSSGGRSKSGLEREMEPESPMMGKGKNWRGKDLGTGMGMGRPAGSPLMRSASEAGMMGMDAYNGRMDEYNTEKQDNMFPRHVTSNRSASSSSTLDHTPPQSGTSIRSTSSQASSSATSYRSVSGLTNTSISTSNSVTLTPPFDDPQSHAVDPGSSDSVLGTSRSTAEGKRTYGPAARLHSGQAYRPFGRTVSQPHTKSGVMGQDHPSGDTHEKYMLGRSAGSSRLGSGSAAVDLVAVLGRKGRESDGHEHDIDEGRSHGLTSEESTFANSSSTTLVPARPSAIRSLSNTSSRGTIDSPSALGSNAYTPANTGRVLSSSTTSASRSRPTVPSRFGLPVRRKPEAEMLVEDEAEGSENVGGACPDDNQVEGSERYPHRSSPPYKRNSSPPRRSPPIRAEPSTESGRRYSPPARPDIHSIPTTIAEDEESVPDLMQRPILPRPVSRPRSVSYSPNHEGGTGTIVAGTNGQPSADPHRRSPSHPQLSGHSAELIPRRDAPMKPSYNSHDPYAAYDLVRRSAPAHEQEPQHMDHQSTRPASAASHYRTSPPLQRAPQAEYPDPGQGHYGHYEDHVVRTTTPAPPAGKKVFTVNKLEYERLYKLGKGGSGTVYAVLHPVKRVAVALKRVAFNGCDADTIANYKNEVDLLARLSGHDRIIKLLDFEITVGGNGKAKSLTVIMEAGEASFDALLDEQSHKPLNLSWVAMYWEQMLEGVQAVHEQRVVHTDLKPANFVLVKGKLKIIDFGIAKAIANDTVNIHRDQQIGSINYMSPEAINKMNTGNLYKLGFPSDVWSMGCILYQMIYGKCPFSQIQGGAYAKFAYIGGGQFTIRYKKRYNSEIGAFSKDELDEPADSIVTKAAIDAMEACLKFDQQNRKTIPELMQCSFLHPERDLKATVITRANMAQLVTATYNVRDLIERGGTRDIRDQQGRIVGEETVLGATPQERLTTYATGLMEQLQMVNGQISAHGF